MRTIAVFGGSFNPPHIAHVLATTLVLSTEDVDEVLVIPTFRHPLAKALAPYEHRVCMCELAMGWLPGVRISRIEEELGGESLTLHTLERLQADYPSAKFRLVIGGDVLNEASKWFHFEKVTALAPPIVLGRRGVNENAILPEVSSTELRAALSNRTPAPTHLIPRRVLSYIRETGLYSSP